jgi:hypothetical protein
MQEKQSKKLFSYQAFPSPEAFRKPQPYLPKRHSKYFVLIKQNTCLITSLSQFKKVIIYPE